MPRWVTCGVAMACLRLRHFNCVLDGATARFCLRTNMILRAAPVLENAVTVIAKISIRMAGFSLVLFHLNGGRSVLYHLPEWHISLEYLLFTILHGQRATWCDLLGLIVCNYLLYKLELFLDTTATAAGLLTVVLGVSLTVLVDVGAVLAVKEELLSRSTSGRESVLHLHVGLSLLGLVVR